MNTLRVRKHAKIIVVPTKDLIFNFFGLFVYLSHLLDLFIRMEPAVLQLGSVAVLCHGWRGRLRLEAWRAWRSELVESLVDGPASV